MTIHAAFRAGILRLRRAAWGPDLWLELVPNGDLLSPLGVLHSVREGADVPPDEHLPPQAVPLRILAEDGWLPQEV